MNDTPAPKRRFGCLQVFLFAVLAALAAIVASFLVFRAVYFPSALRPVRLNAREEQVLQVKVDRLDFGPKEETAGRPASESYTEKGADRTIRFTEKELNALLARHTGMADRLAVDLSDQLLSVQLLIPLEEGFPVFGGRTLRVKAGVSFRYADGRPSVVFRGVSVMGLPVPSAWLGGLKDIDLLKESVGDAGFWKAFAEGVEDLRVEEDCISLTLRE